MDEEKIEDREEEELLKEYRSTGKEGGAPAAQAVVCLGAAGAVWLAGRISPGLGGELLAKIKALSESPAELIHDPIELLLRLIDKL